MINIPTDNEIQSFYEKYAVPSHVIKHMKAVADFQDEILDMLEEKGYEYDRLLLRAAALLHDIARLEKNHAAAGARYLAEAGYPEISEIVALHHSVEMQKNEIPGPAEILFYADKRVAEDQVISIEDRFARSLAKCKTPEALKKHAQLKEKSLKIEKLLF